MGPMNLNAMGQNYKGGMPTKFPRRLFLYVLAAEVFALQLISSMAKTQDYPTRPVKLIVPYAAGGPTDVWARLVAQIGG